MSNLNITTALAELAQGKKLVIGRCSICHEPSCYALAAGQLRYETGCFHVQTGKRRVEERDEADLRALLESNTRREWEWLG